MSRPLPSSRVITVSSVVYARSLPPRALSASWTCRTVASPRPQTSSITSCSRLWRAGGADISAPLQLERTVDVELLAAHGHGPRGGVVAALHALQRAALEVDDLAGDDRDLRDRGGTRGRALDGDRAADRVQRVAGVADREDQLTTVALADHVGGADAQVRVLACWVEAHAADEVPLRDDPVARRRLDLLGEDLEARVERAARGHLAHVEVDLALARGEVEGLRAGHHVRRQARALVEHDLGRAAILDPRAHHDGDAQRVLRRVLDRERADVPALGGLLDHGRRDRHAALLSSLRRRRGVIGLGDHHAAGRGPRDTKAEGAGHEPTPSELHFGYLLGFFCWF